MRSENENALRMQESTVFDCHLQRTCEVNRMGENSSFIFTCYVKTVPVYDFKLVWIVLKNAISISIAFALTY